MPPAARRAERLVHGDARGDDRHLVGAQVRQMSPEEQARPGTAAAG